MPPRASPSVATPTRTTTTTGETAVVDAATEGASAWATADVDPRLRSGPFASHVLAGRYEVLGTLGGGAQGQTFRALDRKTGAQVAVKLFDLGNAKDWKAAELFAREARTLARLSHPGIPALIDTIVDDDTGARALVMTHVPGETLEVIVRRDGPVPEKRLWSILVDVVDALSTVHGEGLVHRDLKPANLVQRPDGALAIVDFGGVGHVRGAAGSTIVGTFGYMAPEQLYGAQTAATDLYALGATVLTLATAREPEDQPRDGLRLDVDTAAPHLSPPLRALLQRLLAPDPKERPADAAAVQRELQALVDARAPVPDPADALMPDDVDGLPLAASPDTAVALGVLATFAGSVGALVLTVLARIALPIVVVALGLFLGAHERRRLQAWQGEAQDLAARWRARLVRGARAGAARAQRASSTTRTPPQRTHETRDGLREAKKAYKRAKKANKEARREARDEARRKARLVVDAFWRD